MKMEKRQSGESHKQRRTRLPSASILRGMIVALFFLSAAFPFPSALPDNHVEDYFWSFSGGNLLTNWSFENLTDEMCPILSTGAVGAYETQTDCHYKLEPPFLAKSGQRVLYTVFKNDGEAEPPDGGIPPVSQISQRLPVDAGMTYRLSFYFKTEPSENIPASAQVCWASHTTLINCKVGDPYSELVPGSHEGLDSDWLFYSMEFTPDAGAVVAWTALVYTGEVDIIDPEDPDDPNRGPGDKYWFDNVIIKPVETQDDILETRSYGDAAGRVEQVITFDGFTEVVTVREFDNQGRIALEYLPIERGTPLFQDISSGVTVISALDLSADGIEVDYSTLLEAHIDLANQVSHLSISDIGEISIPLYVVVGADGDLAPVGAAPGEIQGLSTLEGFPISLDIIGVIQGSDAYENLKTLAATEQQAPMSTETSTGLYSGNLQADLEANYGIGANPVSQYVYPTPGDNTVFTRSLPGPGYELQGDKTLNSGTALVNNTLIPQDPEFNPGDEGPGFQEVPYQYSWSRDPQGNYSVSLADAQGRTIKSGANLTSLPTQQADWKLSLNEYDSFSRLEKTVSPDGKETSFIYNSRGQVIQVKDPDRGIVQSTYDKLGQLRFSYTVGQDFFLATKYDQLGRPLGATKVEGTSGLTPDNAENPTYPPQLLEEGVIYDEITTTEFFTRTGFQAVDIGAPLSELYNTQGKVSMSYKLNQDPSPSPLGLDDSDLFSASFYSYDSLGRQSEVYKYVGTAPSGHKWHKIKYEYETFGSRLQSRTIYTDASETEISTSVSYIYDERGQISEVIDQTDPESPQVMAVYHYNFRGQTKRATLYGKFTMNYQYDVQNKIRELNGYTSEGNIFSQYMGYESKVHTELPEETFLPTSRFDGKINSSLMKYSSATTSPVEYRTYEYQPDGPLSESKRYKGVSEMVNPSDGSLNFEMLSVFTEPSQDEKHRYEYALDGGLTRKTIDRSEFEDVEFNYFYNPDNHSLSQVEKVESGQVSTASFSYDDEGRINSQTGEINPKEFVYNFSGLPVRVESNDKIFHFFYDENNHRVATWIEEEGSIVERKSYIYEKGLKVAKEIRDNGTSVKTLVHLYGRGGLIGVMDEATRNKRLLVKDHQGSVVQVIDEGTGQPLDQTYYADYGVPTKKVNSSDDLNPSEGWTGKEYNSDLALLYFGARFFDPTFGVWLTPDPAGQFFNPYSFGGDPINYVDPDGEFIQILGAIVGGVLGAYQAYRQGYGLLDWQTYALIGGGALVGGVTGGVGAHIGTATAGIGTFGSAAIAGGYAGFVGGVGNYALNSAVNGTEFNPLEAGRAGLIGAASGAVGGGVSGSGIFGTGGYNALGSGFAGGTAGGLLSGKSFEDALLTGAISGGIATGVYTANWAYQNYKLSKAGITISTSEEGTTKPLPGDPKRPAEEWEINLRDDFKQVRGEGMKLSYAHKFRGESAQFYKLRIKWDTNVLGAERIGDASHFVKGQNTIPQSAVPEGSNVLVHSHPLVGGTSHAPSLGDADGLATLQTIDPSFRSYMVPDVGGGYFEVLGGDNYGYHQTLSY